MALTSSSSSGDGGGDPSVAPSTSSAPLSSTPARGHYLSARGLQRLKEYKYVSAPLSSFIDQKMTHFWEFTVNLMPMWLASVEQEQTAGSRSSASLRCALLARPHVVTLLFVCRLLSIHACRPNLVRGADRCSARVEAQPAEAAAAADSNALTPAISLSVRSFPFFVPASRSRPSPSRTRGWLTS